MKTRTTLIKIGVFCIIIAQICTWKTLGVDSSGTTNLKNGTGGAQLVSNKNEDNLLMKNNQLGTVLNHNKALESSKLTGADVTSIETSGNNSIDIGSAALLKHSAHEGYAHDHYESYAVAHSPIKAQASHHHTHRAKSSIKLGLSLYSDSEKPKAKPKVSKKSKPIEETVNESMPVKGVANIQSLTKQDRMYLRTVWAMFLGFMRSTEFKQFERVYLDSDANFAKIWDSAKICFEQKNVDSFADQVISKFGSIGYFEEFLNGLKTNAEFDRQFMGFIKSQDGHGKYWMRFVEDINLNVLVKSVFNTDWIEGESQEDFWNGFLTDYQGMFGIEELSFVNQFAQRSSPSSQVRIRRMPKNREKPKQFRKVVKPRRKIKSRIRKFKRKSKKSLSSFKKKNRQNRQIKNKRRRWKRKNKNNRRRRVGRRNRRFCPGRCGCLSGYPCCGVCGCENFVDGVSGQLQGIDADDIIDNVDRAVFPAEHICDNI